MSINVEIKVISTRFLKMHDRSKFIDRRKWTKKDSQKNGGGQNLSPKAHTRSRRVEKGGAREMSRRIDCWGTILNLVDEIKC